MNTRYMAAEYRLAHWAQVMQSRKDSGLSVREFCDQAGFHENSYYYWQKKLREATCEEISKIQGGSASLVPAVFAEVKLAARSGSSPTAAADQSHVSVEAAGVRITACGGYPADKLIHLLRAVMRPC